MEDGKLFSVGQQVTPIEHPLQWVDLETDQPAKGPKSGEVYRVRGHQSHQGLWFISFEEFGFDEWYPEIRFAPVLTDDQLVEMIREEVAV